MKIKLLFIQDGKINRKLNQVKLIKDLFGIGLKEAKDAKERKELMKYKSLYLDLVGSIHSIIDTFPKE